jgi:hypothetical protein
MTTSSPTLAGLDGLTSEPSAWVTISEQAPGKNAIVGFAEAESHVFRI